MTSINKAHVNSPFYEFDEGHSVDRDRGDKERSTNITEICMFMR